MKKLIPTFIFFIFCSDISFSQNHSTALINNDLIVGELKDMDRGILKIDTAYSDSAFTIEWFGIKEIYSKTVFLITTNDGDRFSGHIKSLSTDTIEISSLEGYKIKVAKRHIVYLKSLDSGFWSQLYASIDFGFNFTKASNLKQLSVRSNVGYLAKKRVKWFMMY